MRDRPPCAQLASCPGWEARPGHRGFPRRRNLASRSRDPTACSAPSCSAPLPSRIVSACLQYPKRMKGLTISEVSTKPQVVFVVANHRPVSDVLHRELRNLPPWSQADYLMATVTHSGYALFKENMVPLDRFVAERTLREPGAEARSRAVETVPVS